MTTRTAKQKMDAARRAYVEAVAEYYATKKTLLKDIAAEANMVVDDDYAQFALTSFGSSRVTKSEALFVLRGVVDNYVYGDDVAGDEVSAAGDAICNALYHRLLRSFDMSQTRVVKVPC